MRGIVSVYSTFDKAGICNYGVNWMKCGLCMSL